jgi:hypothetical protein
MTDFGDIDGRFEFFAVVTPDGRIPKVDDEEALNDPAVWYTGPIATLTHLSDYALVFCDWDDANADFQRHRRKLPEGTKIRAFGVRVEEILNAYAGVGREGELSAVAGQRRRKATAGTPYPALPLFVALSSVGLTTEWHRWLLPVRPLLPSLAFPTEWASPETPFSSTRKEPCGSSCLCSGVRSWARSCTWAT